MEKAKVLYDFDGEEGNGELTVREGDVVTVIRQNVGDGWWEAETSTGQKGLVPEAWMEIMRGPPAIPSGPPSAPPPTQTYEDDDWDDDDDDDDDWDDSEKSSVHQESGINGAGNFGLHSANRDRKGSEPTGKGTVKLGFANRFSVFAKAGGEDYLLGSQEGKSKSVSGTILYTIVDSEDGPVWGSPREPFHVDIKNPKKETKLKGIKSFICYQVTPSNTGIQVSRRYKHFDWLYARLCSKFVTIVVPPLPDKQVTGRYEDSFIEKRMDQLSRWLERMTAHPVVSQCDVFLHFLTCTDGKEWKKGKRDAEKDDFLGAAFFQVLGVPQTVLDITVVERQHENFHKFVKSMEASMGQITHVIHEHGKRHIGPFKREYQKMGRAFKEVATSFELDTRPRINDIDAPTEGSQQLTDAIKFTGKTYDEIGDLFAAQPRNDNYILEDFLREYTGMLSCFPDMISFHKHTISTVKECQKQREEQKMEFDEAEQIKTRADVVSYGMMAEINHFQRQRVYDYKEIMKLYLGEQIKFYEAITEKLRAAMTQYDNVNV